MPVPPSASPFATAHALAPETLVRRHLTDRFGAWHDGAPDSPQDAPLSPEARRGAILLMAVQGLVYLCGGTLALGLLVVAWNLLGLVRRGLA